ncbi:hypothetical protein NQ317_005886 [Molorchus minor]|uniref:GP-PDE domain-containing protein n=1 Tax=Molorchus minor TaxID=1323400 RepID=A0ABQ9JYL4_9CUCU|nr:hypothetical protein NQ317_005886 [Molorchus minor]
MSEALEESISGDTQDAVEHPKYAFTEVASLLDDDPSFKIQEQFGHEVVKDDMLIYQSTVLFPANVAFLIDLYIYSSRCMDGEPPYHAGFSYLLPTVLQSSEGNVTLPVTSTKHRPLGQLRIDYLVIGPMPHFKCDMSISYARHWKKTRSGLDVGHRGSGSSFKTKVQNCAEVRENTIASLKNAIEYGADFVEFDVQLSKDLVPIIYHDFHVCIAMKKKKDIQDNDMLEIPLKELTLDQLRLLKVYHLSEGKTKNPRFFDEELGRPPAVPHSTTSAGDHGPPHRFQHRNKMDNAVARRHLRIIPSDRSESVPGHHLGGSSSVRRPQEDYFFRALTPISVK